METPERNALRVVQTPQIFRIGLLKMAYKALKITGAIVTDDASAVELMGVPVTVAEGSYENNKITTPEDLLWAKVLLREKGEIIVNESIHVSFTFAIEGVSRVLTHQLVRHRIASYSQQSQRYVKEHNFATIMPPSISAIPEAKAKFEAINKEIQSLYTKWTEMGIPAEDARYILPNAAETKIVVTMNARALHHFFELRCCSRAQWEIRTLAEKMLVEVKKIAPALFENAGPT